MLLLAGNASVPANCALGNGGPLCGLCLPGYALQSGVCAACNPADAFVNWRTRNKIALLVGCAAFGVIFIAFAFFQPLAPALERISDAVLAWLRALPSRLMACCCCCCLRSSKRHSVAPREEEEPYEEAHEEPHEQPHAHAQAPHGAPAHPRLSEAENVLNAPAAAEAVAEAAAGAAPHPSVSSVVRSGRFGIPRSSTARTARQSGMSHGAGSDAAFAVGIGMAVFADGVSEEGSRHGDAEGVVNSSLDFMDMLEEQLEKFKKTSKILIKCVVACAV